MAAADFLRLILADPTPTGRGWSMPIGSTIRACLRGGVIRVQLRSLRCRPGPKAPPCGAGRGAPRRASVVWAEPLPGLANRWDWIRGFRTSCG